MRTSSETPAHSHLAVHGIARMSDFFGDFIVYRRLEPPDPRLPGLPDLWPQLGWPAYRIPRKAEPDYAVVVAEILRAARRLEAPRASLTHLIFIGDTRMNDGTAFANLCAAGGWNGQLFIGADRLHEPRHIQIDGPQFVANRWNALADFVGHLRGQGFPLDERTAVVIDMDKTTVGARGRNDRVIDGARVRAVFDTVAGALGEAFDPARFQRAYDTFGVAQFHPFTGDNQDVLAYLCLMIGAGMVDLDQLRDAVQAGTVPSFDAFIRSMDQRAEELRAAGLLDIHCSVFAGWQAGDPTPFKAFRYREYETTAALFDPSPAESIEHVLASRIVITSEVQQIAGYLRAAGTLVFGLSDKPDEASIPTPAGQQRGMQPLHRCATLSIGEKLAF